MRWLQLIGLCLDGVGATLMAFPFIVPSRAARERTIERWGGNPWHAAMRAAETRYVQVGALFLVSGFALQALSSIVGLDSRRVAAYLLVGLTGLAGIALGVWIAGRGQPKYATSPDAAIRDQGHAYGVSSVSDYHKLLIPYVREKHGRLPVRLSARAAAKISSGEWRVSCPECGHSTVVAAWPDNPDAICTDGGHIFCVDFPPEPERLRIEQALAQRPRERRHWEPGDLVEG